MVNRGDQSPLKMNKNDKESRTESKKHSSSDEIHSPTTLSICPYHHCIALGCPYFGHLVDIPLSISPYIPECVHIIEKKQCLHGLLTWTTHVTKYITRHPVRHPPSTGWVPQSLYTPLAVTWLSFV